MEFLLRIPLLQRLFGHQPKEDSRQAARNRLQSALVGDRCSVAPGLSDSIRQEMRDLLARYMEVDAASLHLKLEPSGGGMRWSAQVEVVRVHRQAHLPVQALKDSRATKKARTTKRSLRGARWRRSQEEFPSLEEKSA